MKNKPLCNILIKLESLWRMIAKAAAYVGIPLYIFMMVVKPWIDGSSWDYVQGVWLDWQTLNAGFLAISAGLIAFISTEYRQKQDDKKNRKLAKSMLITIAEHIYDFCQKNATLLLDALDNGNEIDGYRTAQYALKPDKEFFEELRISIKYLDDNETNFLISVNQYLQQAKANVDDLYRPNRYNKKHLAIIDIDNVDDALLRLGELVIFANTLLKLGRGDHTTLQTEPYENNEKIDALYFLTDMQTVVGDMHNRYDKRKDFAGKIQAYINKKTGE